MSIKKIFKTVEHRVFWPSLVVVLAICIPIIFNPQGGQKAVAVAMKFATGNFGWAYMWFTVGAFALMIWLSFSKYGNIKMGRADDKPVYSEFSYVSMLFCTGYSVGLLLWSFIEGSYYIKTPPFHWLEPHSILAMEWAQTYNLIHRGLAPFAVYCLSAIPIAYILHVRKEPFLRISKASAGVLGSKADGWLGHLIDVFVVFGIVGGVGTSLGLAVPLGSAIAGEAFGLTDGFGMQMAILALWSAIFMTSCWRGLDKGIKTLSHINVWMCLALVIFVFIVGPTGFILKSFTNSIGLYFNSFFQTHFWMDPINQGGFPEGWTVFYWAWFIAFAPFMGLFVARISKGRTIKQIAMANIVWSTLGAWFAFTTFGNYAMYLNVNGIVDVAQILADNGQAAAIIAILKTLPVGNFMIIFYFVILSVFMATSMDSAAFTISSVCTVSLTGDEQPPRWHRMLWALVLAVEAVGLLAIGTLKTVQTAAIVGSLPLIPILTIMVISGIKLINQDMGDLLISKPITIDHKLKENVNMVTSRVEESSMRQ